MIQEERGKIIPSKKRLFGQRWQFFSFLKHNGTDVMVLSVYGSLRSDDCKRIFEIVEQNLEKGINNFIIDFSDVRHIHYNDVSLLVRNKENIEKRRGEMKFVVKRSYLLDILFFGGWPFGDDVYPSEKCAMRAFKE